MFHWLMKKVSDPQEPEVVIADESLDEGSRSKTPSHEHQPQSEDSSHESSFNASNQCSPKEHIAESISRLGDHLQIEEIDKALEFPQDATSLAEDSLQKEPQPVNDREMTVNSSKDFGVLFEYLPKTEMHGQCNMHNNYNTEELDIHHSHNPSCQTTGFLDSRKSFQDEGSNSDGFRMSPSPHASSDNGELHLTDHLSSENLILESSSVEMDFGSQKGNSENKSLYSLGKDVHMNTIKESFCDGVVESVPASSSPVSHCTDSEENPFDETVLQLKRTATDTEFLMSKMFPNPCSLTVDTLQGENELHNIDKNVYTRLFPSRENLVSIGDVSAHDSGSTTISREAANFEANIVSISFLPSENTAVIPDEVTTNVDRKSKVRVRKARHKTKFKNTGEVHKTNSPDTSLGEEHFMIKSCNYPYPCCTHSFCLYNQSGKLCTVLGQRYIFTEVYGAPLLVCLEESADTPVRPCKILWRGSIPLALSQIEDGTDVMFDATVMPSSKKVVAVILWHTCKPSVISHLQQGSMIFVEEVTGFQVQLISFNKKKTGVIKAIINGQEENVTFSTEVVFLNSKKMSSKTDLNELFKYPSSQIYATLNKFLSGDVPEKFVFVPSCIWNGAKPNGLLLRPPLVQGKVYNVGHNFNQPGVGLYSNLHCDVPCLLSVTKTNFMLDFALDNETQSVECTSEELYYQNNQVLPVSSSLPFTVKVKAHILEKKMKLQVKKYKVIMVQVPDVTVIKVKTNDQAVNANNEVKSSGDVLKGLPHKLLNVPEAFHEVPVMAAESKEVAEHVCNDISTTSEVCDEITSEEKEAANDFSAASSIAETPNLSLPECKLTYRGDIIENLIDSVDDLCDIQEHEVIFENNDSLHQEQVPVQLSGSSSSVTSVNQCTPPDAPDLSHVLPEPLSSMSISADSTKVPLEVPDTELHFPLVCSSTVSALNSLISETITSCDTQLSYASSDACSVSSSNHDDSLLSSVRSSKVDFDMVQSSSHDRNVASSTPVPLDIPNVQNNPLASISMSPSSSILCQLGVDESPDPAHSTAVTIYDNFESISTSVQNLSLHMRESSRSSSISSDTSSSSSQPFFSPSVGSPLLSGSSSLSLCHTPSTVSQEDISTFNPTDNAKATIQSCVNKLKKASDTRKCSSLTSLSCAYNASMSKGHWSNGVRVSGPSSSIAASSFLSSACSSEAVFNTSSTFEEIHNIQPKIAGLSSDTKGNILDGIPTPSVSQENISSLDSANNAKATLQSFVNKPKKASDTRKCSSLTSLSVASNASMSRGRWSFGMRVPGPSSNSAASSILSSACSSEVIFNMYEENQNIQPKIAGPSADTKAIIFDEKLKPSPSLLPSSQVFIRSTNTELASKQVNTGLTNSQLNTSEKPKLYRTFCKIKKVFAKSGIVEVEGDIFTSNPKAHFLQTVAFVGGEMLTIRHPGNLLVPNYLITVLTHYKDLTWECLVQKCKQHSVSNVAVNITVCLMWLGKVPEEHYNKCVSMCDLVNLFPQKLSHSSHVGILPPNAPPKKVKKLKLYLTNCKIVKLTKNGGILRANENVSRSIPVADFTRRVVFVNGKSALGNDSDTFRTLLEPYQNEIWTCLLLKSKARIFSLVSVNFTACLMWIGKLPTKQYNKLKKDNELIQVASDSLVDEACSQQKVQKIPPPHKTPSVSPSQKMPVSPSQMKPKVASLQKMPNLSTSQQPVLTKQNLPVAKSLKTVQSKATLRKGVVTKVKNTTCYLKPCEESANGELEFTRHKCFLFSVSLKDTHLKDVIAADLQVDYEENEGQIQAVYVGGSYADTQDHATRYYLLSAWCEHYKVPLKTKETLLLEVGWLPPELCPLASSADNQVVNAK